VLTLSKVDGAYQNLGTLAQSGGGSIVVPATATGASFSQDGGTITSTNNNLTLSLRAGTFTLKGGQVPTRTAANPRPVVVLNGASLVLDAAATEAATIGVIASAAVQHTITGHVPAATTLWLGGPTDGQAGTLFFPADVMNAGTIIPVRQIDVFGGPLTLAGAGRLTNTGTISQTRSSGALARFRYDLNLTNTGTITVTDGTSIDLVKQGGVHNNSGAISLGPTSGVMQLVVQNGVFENGAAGSVTGGSLIADGGTVLGSGSLVTSLISRNGGVIEPGHSTGQMPVLRFLPAATGILRIELGGLEAGTGYDQLRVEPVPGEATAVSLGGTLEIVELEGFEAGLCGQLFDVVTFPNPSGFGAFGEVTGLAPAPGRLLRVVYRGAAGGKPGAVSLVGYDASKKICVGPKALSASEGGPGVQYAVTLDHAPTTPVVVQVAPDNQVTVEPSSLTFTSSTWQIPQFITVTAVDDTDPEGTHPGNISHSVTTTDATFAGFVPDAVAVSITDNDVNLPPTAGADLATTDEDTPVVIDVLANDSDPDHDPLTIESVDTPGKGTAQISNGGTRVSYTPAAGVSGQDSFTYTVNDGRGEEATATVTVTINPVNDLPVAQNDNAVTRTRRAVVIPVLANDSDADQDALLVTQISQPANGTAVLAPDGKSVTYTSAARFIGSDQFGYTVSDGHGGSATATVFVTVVDATTNTAPVAVNDAAQITNGQRDPVGRSIRIQVLDNDFDAEGDRIRLVQASGASHGTTVVSGRSVVYTVSSAAQGFDQFTYTIDDGFGGVDVGIVQVTWSVPSPRVDFAVTELFVLGGNVPTILEPHLVSYGVHTRWTAPGLPVNTWVTVEYELPDQTVAAGQVRPDLPTLPPPDRTPFASTDLVAGPDCSITHINGVARRYTCRRLHSAGSPQWSDSFLLMIPRSGEPRFPLSVRITPELNDPRPGNNDRRIVVRKDPAMVLP
jgi:hypothetical protein